MEPEQEKRYVLHQSYETFYTGGDICWSSNGKHLYCHNSEGVCKVNVSTGLVDYTYSMNTQPNDDGRNHIHKNDEDDCEDTIYNFDVSFCNNYLVTVHRSSLIRLWEMITADDHNNYGNYDPLSATNKRDEHHLLKLWKSQHRGPMVKVCFSGDYRLICTSASDTSLRIWDWTRNCCICALREFEGPAPLIKFHANLELKHIFAVGHNHAVYRWDYETKELIHTMRGHYSAVTDMSFSPKTNDDDYEYLVTVGRDKVVIIWNLEDGKQYKLIPFYEELIGVNYLNERDLLIVDRKSEIMAVLLPNVLITDLGQSVQDCEVMRVLSHPETNRLMIITSENNLIIYQIKDKLLQRSLIKKEEDSTVSSSPLTFSSCFQQEKQLIGNNSEILDICYLGKDENYLAMATNSIYLKLYDIDNNMNCKIFAGHSGIIITLSSPGRSNLLLTAGRDFSIRLWQLDTDNFKLNCLLAFPNAHTASIGCICFATLIENTTGKKKSTSSPLFASVCQSGSLKLWSISEKQEEGKKDYQFLLKYATVAHEKEVNSICFAPNNKLLATASQDKTVKLWKTDGGANTDCIATLRGHTRSVWCARFSPVDQVLMTSSSDCSIRIWSLAHLTCLKRFDGTCSILKAEFIDHGRYVIASSSDGLIKVYSIKNNVCVQTLEGHDGRIWSMAVSGVSEKYFFSAAADSKLIRWIDSTEEMKNEHIIQRQLKAEEEQLLQNYLNGAHTTHQAFRLAIKLNKPRVTYNLLKQQQNHDDVIQSWLISLNEEEHERLLDHVKNWSTHTRYAQVANRVLKFLLDYIMSKPETERCSYTTGRLVESLMPYIQRHFKRITDLQQQIYFAEYLVQGM